MLHNLEICDNDYGLLKSFSLKNEKVLWSFSISINKNNTTVIMEGSKLELNPLYKQLLKELLINFDFILNQINSQSQNFIDEPFTFNFENPDIHIKEINIWSTVYDITFQNISNNCNYIFNFNNLILEDAIVETL